MIVSSFCLALTSVLITVHRCSARCPRSPRANCRPAVVVPSRPCIPPTSPLPYAVLSKELRCCSHTAPSWPAALPPSSRSADATPARARCDVVCLRCPVALLPLSRCGRSRASSCALAPRRNLVHGRCSTATIRVSPRLSRPVGRLCPHSLLPLSLTARAPSCFKHSLVRSRLVELCRPAAPAMVVSSSARAPAAVVSPPLQSSCAQTPAPPPPPRSPLCPRARSLHPRRREPLWPQRQAADARGQPAVLWVLPDQSEFTHGCGPAPWRPYDTTPPPAHPAGRARPQLRPPLLRLYVR